MPIGDFLSLFVFILFAIFKTKGIACSQAKVKYHRGLCSHKIIKLKANKNEKQEKDIAFNSYASLAKDEDQCLLMNDQIILLFLPTHSHRLHDKPSYFNPSKVTDWKFLSVLQIKYMHIYKSISCWCPDRNET